jgi:CRP/FNR family cyclic AMP-dependent transcriptional regulator
MNSLRDLTLFASIDESANEKYSDTCEWKQYDEHELIFDEDDSSRDLRCVVSGRVRVISQIGVGKQLLLDELGEGEFFGEIAAIDNEMRSANVTTLSKTELCIVPQRIFQRLLWDSREVNFEILRVMTKRIRTLNTRLAEQFFLQPKHRLYVEILRLSEPSYVQDNHRLIRPMLNSQELAERIGTKTEVVAKELEMLEERAIVTIGKDELVLIDVAELQNQISEAWNR